MKLDAPFDAGTYFNAAHAFVCGCLLAVAGLVAGFVLWSAVLRRREHRLLTRCIDAELRALSRREAGLSLVSDRLAQQKARLTAPWKCLQGGKTDSPHQG